VLIFQYIIDILIACNKHFFRKVIY
jgi:hypothetical protein